MTPHQMLERLLGPSAEDAGVIANDFLAELGRTIPVESLRQLLTSKQRHIRAHGAFIAAETCCDLHSMLSELVALLDDDEPRICGDAIEAVGRTARREDSDALARILLCLGHPEPFPRYMAIKFFRFCPPWKLERACRQAQLLDPSPAFSHLARLIEGWRSNVPGLLEQLLQSSEPVIARFGLAMAGRPYPTIVDRFLAQASESNDPQISELARDWQKETDPKLNRVWHFWHSDMPD